MENPVLKLECLKNVLARFDDQLTPHEDEVLWELVYDLENAKRKKLGWEQIRTRETGKRSKKSIE